MKQAIIDIGSNSIRLTLYETQGQSFHILFREKIMAGLAGYVEDGKLSAEGIECACAGLLTFRGILQTLEIQHIRVFATASLRNISNTEQALSVIRAATGYAVEIIPGEEEALLGYAGAMQELHLTSGAFLGDDCRSMTAWQLDGLCKFLCSGKKEASDLILRLEPERIHTLVPGILILRHVFHLFQAEQLIVSKYGVREGYLCQKMLKNNIDTPKTED